MNSSIINPIIHEIREILVVVRKNVAEGVELFDQNFSCIKESRGNTTTVIDDLQYKKLWRFNGASSRFTIEISSDTRLNNLLFALDIKKWEEIKYMKYGQYIHQQLEMFNFIEMDS